MATTNLLLETDPTDELPDEPPDEPPAASDPRAGLVFPAQEGFTPLDQLRDEKLAAAGAAALRAAGVDADVLSWRRRLHLGPNGQWFLAVRYALSYGSGAPAHRLEEERETPWTMNGLPAGERHWADSRLRFFTIVEGLQQLRAGAEAELERRARLVREHEEAIVRERRAATERQRRQDEATAARAARDRELRKEEYEALPLWRKIFVWQRLLELEQDQVARLAMLRRLATPEPRTSARQFKQARPEARDTAEMALVGVETLKYEMGGGPPFPDRRWWP